MVTFMANLIRSPKSGSDWSPVDLEAYNIVVDFNNTPSFFGVDHLPQPTVDPEVWTTQDAKDMVSDRNAELVCLLELATHIVPDEESAVTDFAIALFKLLGYVRRDRIARTRKDISYLICEEWKLAKTDACLLDTQKNDILLVVQEDKTHLGQPRNVTHRLVASAIAAFEYNNRMRDQVLGQTALEPKVCIPVIR